MVALEDLRSAGCDILTLGQYLQPTLKHLPVVEFVSPENLKIMAGGRGNWFCSRGQRPDGTKFLPRGRIQPAISGSIELTQKDCYPERGEMV